MTGSLKTFLQTGQRRAGGSSTNFTSFTDMVYNFIHLYTIDRCGAGMGAVDSDDGLSHVAKKGGYGIELCNVFASSIGNHWQMKCLESELNCPSKLHGYLVSV